MHLFLWELAKNCCAGATTTTYGYNRLPPSRTTIYATATDWMLFCRVSSGYITCSRRTDRVTT